MGVELTVISDKFCRLQFKKKMGNLLTTLISFFPFLSYFQEKIEDQPTETSNCNKPSNKDEGEILLEENPVNCILPNSEQNTREEILDIDEDMERNAHSLENTLDLMTRGSESRMMDEFLSENNQNCIN